MKTAQLHYTAPTGWSGALPSELDSDRSLLLVFGGRAVKEDPRPIEELRQRFPNSFLFGCSSAGEIHAAGVADESLSVAVARFESATLRAATTRLSGPSDSHAAGRRIAAQLPAEGLRAVLVLSAGLNVNGAALVYGLSSDLPAGVALSGGLAADGSAFEHTWVLDNSGLHEDMVAAVGLYGPGLRISHGCAGGWTEFGPERTVTRSVDNLLYELDGQPALGLYKHYLGELATQLPSSALLFPLAMRISSASKEPVVRTILGVDEAGQSMTFAGDIPIGATVRLMRTSIDRLVTGAEDAARHAVEAHLQDKDATCGESLALSVSCVGRRLVMGERTEEEIEAVLGQLPAQAVHAGFYSYGEIAPPHGGSAAQLHNQTLTMTLLSEAR